MTSSLPSAFPSPARPAASADLAPSGFAPDLSPAGPGEIPALAGNFAALLNAHQPAAETPSAEASPSTDEETATSENEPSAPGGSDPGTLPAEWLHAFFSASASLPLPGTIPPLVPRTVFLSHERAETPAAAQTAGEGSPELPSLPPFSPERAASTFPTAGHALPGKTFAAPHSAPPAQPEATTTAQPERHEKTDTPPAQNPAVGADTVEAAAPVLSADRILPSLIPPVAAGVSVERAAANPPLPSGPVASAVAPARTLENAGRPHAEAAPGTLSPPPTTPGPSASALASPVSVAAELSSKIDDKGSAFPGTLSAGLLSRIDAGLLVEAPPSSGPVAPAGLRPAAVSFEEPLALSVARTLLPVLAPEPASLPSHSAVLAVSALLIEKPVFPGKPTEAPSRPPDSLESSDDPAPELPTLALSCDRPLRLQLGYSPEKTAAPSPSPSGEKTAPPAGENRHDQALIVDGKAVVPSEARVGTLVAKRSVAMLPRASFSALAESLPAPEPRVGLVAPGVGELFARPAAEASLPEQPVSLVSRAQETWRTALEAADRVRLHGSSSVEVRFDFSERERLELRVEWRGGELRAIFRTDSADLTQALRTEWGMLAPRAAERGLRIEPSFEPGSASMSFSNTNQEQGRRPSEESAPRRLPSLSFGGRARSSVETEGVAAVSPAGRPARWPETAHHLNATA